MTHPKKPPDDVPPPPPPGTFDDDTPPDAHAEMLRQPRHVDDTGSISNKVRKVVSEELAEPMDNVKSSMATVKRLQFWGAFVLVIAGGGFGASQFFNSYASKAEMDKVAERADEISKRLSDHIAESNTRQAVLEEQAKRAEEDRHVFMRQMQRIADRVGAEKIDLPTHDRGPKP